MHHHSRTIVELPVSHLHPNRRNARTHSKRQIKALSASIKAFGFTAPILIDSGNKVIAGHGRLSAAVELGLETVPTLCIEGLSEAQLRALALADNKLAEMAGWDFDLVWAEISELNALLPSESLDVTITGFSAPEIDQLAQDHGPTEPDPADHVALPEAVAVSKRGDLWLLNHHRVLCGDARSEADVDRVTAPAPVSMLFADPPYNVAIAGHARGRGHTRHREFPFASGELDEAAFQTFLVASLQNAARRSRPGAVHFVCMDWRHVATLIAAGKDTYPALLNICVWAKTNAGQGSFYRSQHEFVCVFRVGDERHQNNVELGRHGRNRSNLWTYPGVNSFGAGRDELLTIHPTVKPIALVIDAMRDCTTRGDVVLDTFLGSGTTLLAAERIGRRCYATEYDPLYVDLAIRRWQAVTKREATLEGDGRTFAAIQAERAAGVVAHHEPVTDHRIDDAATATRAEPIL